MRKIRSLKQTTWLDRQAYWLNVFSICVIAVSIILVILEYMTNRSLWADEVTLAYSVVTRDLTNLTAKILKHRQSAPVLYVYIVKVLTLIGNTSEFWLRIYSFFAYLGTVFLSYRILKDLAKVRIPLLGAAYTASMMILLYFANEFKQYMSDAFTVLLVIFLYERFLHKKISQPVLFALYAVILWLSFPAIFYIGGMAIIIFVRSIIRKNRKEIIQLTTGSLIVIASFVAQYFFWLQKASQDPDLIEHWETFKFPIIPTSLADIIKAGRLLYGMALSINDYPQVDNILRWYPVFVLVLVGIGVLSIFKKFNEATLAIISGTVVMMLASFIGMYPFHPRLILFMYPIMSIFSILAIGFLAERFRSAKWQTLVTGVLVLALFSGNATSLSLFNPDNRLRQNEESRPLIEYVQTHIQPGEYLYVSGADMSLKYLNGYDNLHIGDQVDPAFENIRYGDLNQEAEDRIDLAEFAQTNAYIVISHANLEKIISLVEPLVPYGYLEKIMDVAQTPLFYHAKDLSDLKADVQYRISDIQKDGNIVSGIMEITNTGRSYLNATELPKLELSSRQIESFHQKIAEQDIPPSQTIQVAFNLEIDMEVTPIELQLRYPDQYWFDQLNIEPAVLDLPN